MNKRLLAASGLGLTALVSVALSTPASAAPKTAVAKVVPYKVISGPHTGAPAKGNCGYPVSQAVLTLSGGTQTAAGKFSFSGTYGCNGHALALHKVVLGTTGKVTSKNCSNTTRSGSYGCGVSVKGPSTVTAYTYHAMSNSISVVGK